MRDATTFANEPGFRLATDSVSASESCTATAVLKREAYSPDRARSLYGKFRFTFAFTPWAAIQFKRGLHDFSMQRWARLLDLPVISFQSERSARLSWESLSNEEAFDEERSPRSLCAFGIANANRLCQQADCACGFTD
jgi:hypothetical protein